MMPIQVYVRLPYNLRSDEGLTVASCDALDIHSPGHDEQQAKRNLAEEIELFILSAIRRKTLDSVLEKCGFSRREDAGEGTVIDGFAEESPEPTIEVRVPPAFVMSLVNARTRLDRRP